MANDEYWTVLNSSLLSEIGKDRCLVPRVNALKHAIQTYGPKSDKLPDFRHNNGKSQGFVFHGHAQDSFHDAMQIHLPKYHRQAAVL